MECLVRVTIKRLALFLLVENIISLAFSYTFSTETWHRKLPSRPVNLGNHHPFKPLQPDQQKNIFRPEPVKTIAVTCHSDYIEIAVKADIFELGTPIDINDLHLGVEQYNDHENCRATPSAEGDEYKIYAALSDCGTKNLMNQDSLIYINLLRYTPRDSPEGVIRMDSAVIPVECHYERKYSLDSDSLHPTWNPFISKVVSEDTLQFSLKLMTSDWLLERGSAVYFLGESISIEASVQTAHHTRLRVYVSSCVATLEPDRNSMPRYVLIESDGCLMDSLVPGSRSQFVRRTEDNKLQFRIDAFRFQQQTKDELYITCHVLAVPVMDHAEPSKKACSLIDGRWRSADENDLLCSRCPRPKMIDQAPAQRQLSPRLGGRRPEPRGYPSKHPASGSLWSGLKAKQVWEEDTSLGPIKVYAAKKIGSLTPRMREGIHVPGFPSAPGEGRPISPGSRWKTGMDVKKGLSAQTRNEGSTLDQWVGANNKQGFVSSATYDGYSAQKALIAQRELEPTQDSALTSTPEPFGVAITLGTEGLTQKKDMAFVVDEIAG
ncbi:zona pellucida sperm-binding protein 3-like isoform X2 [Esox lucius]|uniref:Zona pellucida sperm-binding protein 3 n=1 Tax=Esox lucius TaxID=8010 RepID=A0A3P8XQQ2_ESOLU|nr:zona pellucida sperm-binding protein 3-like isoform X2 [Esox lucius]